MKRISHLLFAAAAFAAPACSSDSTGGPVDNGVNCGNGVCDTASGETETSCPLDCAGSGSSDQWDTLLGQRQADYNAALRIASLRLTGHIPTMADMNSVATSADPKTTYNGLITQYMGTEDFKRQMFYFWRDTFRQGEDPVLDTAPALAAQLTVANGSYMSLFTQASGNCPTYADDGTTVTFTAAECGNGGPKAGVLTDPGVMQQFFSNFAFRRVRWIQETFVCTKFPAEVSTTPTDVGGAAPYTGKFPFASISSPTNGGGRVNFQDVSAVVCANCHSNINHIAPLFAYYDMTGQYQTSISVPTPLDGAPMAQLTDYLPSGEATAWRFGVAAADIPAMGADMAADPDVAECGVARMWDWALGKTDIVDTLQIVPPETIAQQVSDFTSGGYKLKDLIYAVYTSDDFVKF